MSYLLQVILLLLLKADVSVVKVTRLLCCLKNKPSKEIVSAIVRM